MAKQTINIGSAPNDGTGDPIRDAFNKVNGNFDELYSSYVASGAVSVGNSTVNSVVSNTGGLVVSNSTVNTVANSSVIKIGNSSANATMTLTQVSVFGNTTIGNTTINTTAMAIGNSSVNSIYSQTALNINTATLSASLNTTSLFFGNSTANVSANTTRLNVKEANVSSNLYLGTYYTGVSNFANGYSRMPNGLLMQWGFNAAVNSLAGGNLTTFSSVGGVAFTNIFSISATSTLQNNAVTVTSANSTAFIVIANTAGNTGVYWIAIGK